MVIYRLLQRSAFTPDDIQGLVSAYEGCLRELKTSPSDPVREQIAKTIIEIGQTGIRDPVKIRQLALEQIEDR